MDSSIVVALIALASAVISAYLNYSTHKDVKRAEKKKEEAEAAAQITKSALDLVHEMEDKLDKLEKECQDMKAMIENKDDRIKELERENRELKEIVETLRKRLEELEKHNGAK